MDVATKAYIAGIIDGEGSIYVERSKRKGRLSGKYTGNLRYRIMVEILMCDLPTLAFIAKATGRPLHTKPLRRNGITRRTHAYYVTWRNGVAADFLRSVLPFLRNKRKQAELALAIHAKIAKPLGVQFTQRDLDYCARMHLKMQALKRPYSVPIAADCPIPKAL
jgi:hypothetical protein